MLRQQSTIQGIQHLQKVASRHEVWRSNKTGTRENRQRTSRQMAPDRYGGAFPTNQKIPEDSVQRRKGTVLLQSGRTESRQTYYRLRICIAADLSPVRSLLPFPFAVRPISPERATDQAKPKGARVRERERERERENAGKVFPCSMQPLESSTRCTAASIEHFSREAIGRFCEGTVCFPG
jgi:hypothetical protein